MAGETPAEPYIPSRLGESHAFLPVKALRKKIEPPGSGPGGSFSLVHMAARGLRDSPRLEDWKLRRLLGLALGLAALLLGAFLATALFLGSLLRRLLLGGSSLLSHSYSSIKRFR